MNVGLRTADALIVALLTVAILACNTGTSGTEGSPRLAKVESGSLISTQQAKLLASDGADFDTFGSSVAVSGNTALVGAPRDDDRGLDAGAVYVFVRSGSSWTQQAKITAADGVSNDNFGVAVALDGDTALIGANGRDDVGSDAGAAYVFVRSGTSWTQQGKLTASDGSSEDQLGFAVALSGDTAVAGAVNDAPSGDHSGSAYVFVRSGTSWTQQAKLIASDGAELDQFGFSVAVSGDTALIGAPLEDAGAADSGSAYVFVRSGASWTQQAKLTAADGAASDNFGTAVALSGSTALVGAPSTDENAVDSGSAYVFVGGGASWTQQAKLTASDASPSDGFGGAVALDGDTAVIGVPNDGDLGAASGSAYVFGRSGTSWTQQAKLLASDGAPVDLFGTTVAVSGNTAVVGAPGHDDLGPSSGSSYVYAPPGSSNGGACATGADCTSGFCADGVCCDTTCGGGDPSDCEACSIAAGAAANGTCGPISAGRVCRPAAGACDVAEQCTGTSTACPADGMIAAGTVCRPAAGACDVAEQCTGTSAACPADGMIAAGTVCRAAAGTCDAAEQCTGTSAACPADGLVAGGTVCRAAVNDCDLTERCTGSSDSCPANEHKPDLSLCHGGLLGLPGLCLAGVCVL